MHKKSFSLIELMVSLSIVLIICSFFFSHLIDAGDSLLVAEQEKLFMTFSYLQQKAMASGQRQHLFFDTDKQLYSYIRLNKAYENKLCLPIEFGFLKGVKGPPSQPKKTIHSAITFPKGGKRFCATFLPDGKVSAGTVYLIDKKRNLLAALTSAVAHVCITRKYRFKGGKWAL